MLIKKDLKLYNVIFPVWLLLFFPPVIFITLIGNYIIDSLVIIICFFMFRLAHTSMTLKDFYKRSIVKVWGFGFLADIIGAAILFIIGILGDFWGVPEELISGINYDPFSNPIAVIVIIFAMLISGVIIFLLNYRFTFEKLIKEKRLKLKVAVAVAVITMPWTFLLPTKWFYYGF